MASKFYIDKSELELKEPIGRGRYGTVRTALYRRKVVAVKTMEEKDDPEFKFVVETLTNLDHENIIKCFGVGSTPDKVVINLLAENAPSALTSGENCPVEPIMSSHDLMCMLCSK